MIQLSHMKPANLQTLKGFRDFLPAAKLRRDYVQSSLIKTATRFGFAPLETPTLEYADLLLGKYGTEADKLVYTFTDKGGRAVGLRYDQTVPTARVLSQYQGELPKFFRRYQTQNVFRADKPQRGRFREFAQFDLDIFGSTNPISDAEILACTYQSFVDLKFDSVQIIINDRTALIAALEPFTNPKVDIFSIIQTIDKLDKQDQTSVLEELVAKGLQEEEANQVFSTLKKLSISSSLSKIVDMAVALGVPRDKLVFEPNLARGLDYYTGLIFEVRVPEYSVGSLGGGGRYDNLIGELGGPKTPAVGIGLGFDRVVEAALELELIPDSLTKKSILVTLIDEQTVAASLSAASALRQAGITTQVYPSLDKLGKQLRYADQAGLGSVLIIGQDELSNNQATLKQLDSGEQLTASLEEIIRTLSSQ